MVNPFFVVVLMKANRVSGTPIGVHRNLFSHRLSSIL